MEIFSRKPHSWKVVKETPQKADARDYEKRRTRRKFFFTGKSDDGVGDDDEGMFSDYVSDAEMSQEMILEKLNHL